jgi:hypothetical protein
VQCDDMRPRKSCSEYRDWFYGLTVEDDAGFEERDTDMVIDQMIYTIGCNASDEPKTQSAV